MFNLLFIIIINIVLLGGCTRYIPMPLSKEAVKRRLAGPDMRNIPVLEASIRHPVLKPVSFNIHDGLSLDEAAILAVIANPDLCTERDRLSLATAQLLQAGLLPNPQLSYAVDIPKGGITEGAKTAYRLGTDWVVTALLGRQIKKDVAELNREQINLSVAWKELQTAHATRMAMIHVIAVREQIKLQKEMEKIIDSSFSDAEKAVEKGLMTESNLAGIRAEQNTVQSAILAMEKEYKKQLIYLKKLMGLPAGYKITVQNNISLPDHISLPVFSEFTGNMQNRRLDMLALKHGYESQEAAVRAAILKQFPGITLGINRAGNDTDLHTIGLGISIEIPVFDMGQGKIAIEHATRQKLFDEYVSRVFNAESDMAMMETSIESLNKQIAHAQKEVEGLEFLVRIYSTALNKGLTDMLTYYNTFNRLTEKRVDMIGLKSALIQTAMSMGIEGGYYIPEKSLLAGIISIKGQVPDNAEPNMGGQ